MGLVVMQATMSLDGFIADVDDGVGPLFDWYGNGDVEFTGADPDRVFHVSRASADYLRSAWADTAVGICGRRLFDITDGWGGQPPASDSSIVVTHSPPTEWIATHPDAPFSFVTEGVERAVEEAKAYAGDRTVSVTPGNVGGQALAAGLVDEVRIDLAPVVLGAGVRYFGAEPVDPFLLDDPEEVVRGDRVVHLRYRVRR
jgi:dihydrofolate reductase